jgi:hypothetical protein
MIKHPLNYKEKDLNKIMGRKIRIDIGPIKEDRITESLEGEIVGYSLAANPPYLPAEVMFNTSDGRFKRFNILKLKGIYIE